MSKQSATVLYGENDIHLVIGAKGGIGKTYVASLFAQFFAHKGQPMKVLDLDQSNAMLARVPSLKGEAVSLLSDGRFDSAKMDQVVRRMSSEPGPFILDVGASMFQEVWRYFTKYRMIPALKSQGRRVVIHSVVIAGPELPDVLNSFSEVAKSIDEPAIIVWLNPLRGAIHSSGKEFLEFSVYTSHRSKVLAVISLPGADDATLRDLDALALSRHTLLTVDQCESLQFFSKHRLAVHRDEVFSPIGAAWEAIHGKPDAA